MGGKVEGMCQCYKAANGPILLKVRQQHTLTFVSEMNDVQLQTFSQLLALKFFLHWPVKNVTTQITGCITILVAQA